MIRSALMLLTLLAVSACGFENASPPDPLPSWNDGDTKAEILDFVRSAVSAGDGFIAPEDRIAAFDNDGTLWCEKPLYFQVIFAFEQIARDAAKNPELTKDPIVAAIVKGDEEALKKADLMEVVKAILPVHADLDADAMQRAAADWTAKTKHPRFERP